jgi:hypothetical protein
MYISKREEEREEKDNKWKRLLLAALPVVGVGVGIRVTLSSILF